jgi:hypothetical protein
MHRAFLLADGAEMELDTTNKADMELAIAGVSQALDMDPDKLSKKTMLKNFREKVEIDPENKKIEIKDEMLRKAVDELNAGMKSVEAMTELWHEGEGYHVLEAIQLLADIEKAYASGESKVKTSMSVEVDAITSGMVLTLLQIATDAAMRMASKGGIYTEAEYAKWKDYVETHLPGTEFTPGALIEAGKVHAKAIEAKMKTAKSDKELTTLRNMLASEAVFKDLYSTIGMDMVTTVEATKAKLGNVKTEEIRQKALLGQIGELTLTNVRTIAKSPVMVYIYGATIGSIKKKLTYSLGVDTLEKTLKKLSNWDYEKHGDENARKAAVKFVELYLGDSKTWQYTDINGKAISQEDANKETVEWRLLNVDLEKTKVDGKTAIEKLDNDIKATFGEAIEEAFGKRFGFVDTNRNVVKAVEMYTFEAYSARLNTKVNKVLGKEGNKSQLTKEELMQINSELLAEGFTHAIEWNTGKGKTINQPLDKTAKQGTGKSAGGRVVNGKYIAEKENVTSQVLGGVDNSNTGAAPTISIHAIDGNLMLETLNKTLAKGITGRNVYDAIILPVRSANMVETTDIYNTEAVEQGFSRTILVDNIAKLERMLGNLSPEEMAEVQKEIAKTDNGFGRELERLDFAGVKANKDLTAEEKQMANLDYLVKALEIVKEAHVAKQEMSKQTMYSGHSHIAGTGIVKVEGKDRVKDWEEPTRLKQLIGVKENQVKEEINAKEDTIRLLNELASNPENAGLNARLNKIIELIKDC